MRVLFILFINITNYNNKISLELLKLMLSWHGQEHQRQASVMKTRIIIDAALKRCL